MLLFANNVEPGQTAPNEQSDLVLLCVIKNRI